MSDLRVQRPIRFRLGQLTYWTVWGPACAAWAVAVLPLAAILAIVIWSSEQALRLGAALAEAAAAHIHSLAVAAGNRVFGYNPKDPSHE